VLRTAALTILIVVSLCSAPAAARDSLCALSNASASQWRLPRVSHLLRLGRPFKVVAVGSSSTAGAGATDLSKTYPARLADEFRLEFPNLEISVLNSGRNGEQIGQMVDRFEHDVFPTLPDLVLWQIGTNAVLRDAPIDVVDARLTEGLERLKPAGHRRNTN
jgi:acyl-CoA thioesterase I